MKFRSLQFVMTLSVWLINIASGAMTMILILLFSRWQPLSFLKLPQVALISSILIGTLISAIYYHRVFKPVDNLIAMTEKVREGNYQVRADPKEAIGNISELLSSFNRMAEQLGSVEMLKSDFINTFSHEFKTPIVSIRGFAKQLKKSNLPEKERQEYIDIIIAESERLATMSTNVLHLSRFENELEIGECADFSLDEQLRSCILMLEKAWESKRIEWELSLDPITVCSNRTVIEHIWINLFSNAVKFSPDGSKIEVSCQADGASAIVTIRDYGEGMSAQTIARIFEKFYQGDTSHAREGNGLGLSIVKRIVELANGEITVISEVGRGTTFRVLLPIRAV